ncbi:MAG: hypothetical protein F6J87_21545 [Spirulina sp. SIO3F2]|nr:hypothetical protein [Spirulina sp. SIO3F2]
MQLKQLRRLTGACAIAACATALSPSAAEAFSWNYSWDSFNDGTGSLMRDGVNYNSRNRVSRRAAHGVGVYSQYEHFGMAYTVTDDSVVFAFNSNLGINGHRNGRAKDGNIGWGDLFINLDPTKSIEEVQGTDSLLGIRFAGQNDSGVDANAQNGYARGSGSYDGTLGVFSGVTSKSITRQNSGWSNYNSFNNYVQRKKVYDENGQRVMETYTDRRGRERQRQAKAQVELVDGMELQESQEYLGQHGRGVIDTYDQRLGGVSVLDTAALLNMGLDFASEAGNQMIGGETFGFSFARSLLPGGDLDWIAHVMAECANDTMGMAGMFEAQKPDDPVSTPEPAMILGLLGVLSVVRKGRNTTKH